MKSLATFILLCFAFYSQGQQVSNLPFEAYWHKYVLEFNDSTVSKNKIKSITAKYTDSKKKNSRHDQILYKVDFNAKGLPTKYLYQKKFSLRNDYRYNPFWRMRNKYPVFYNWTYELQYDSLNRLTRITEISSRTNEKISFFEILSFKYDVNGRVSSQTTHNVNDGFPDIPFNINKYEVQYSADKPFQLIHYVNKTPTDTINCIDNKRVTLANFSFGDKSETFVRNVPYDRNETLFTAQDKNSIILKDDKGLKKSKSQKLDIQDITTVKADNLIVYEYEFY